MEPSGTEGGGRFDFLEPRYSRAMARPYFAPDKTGLQGDFYQLVQAAVYHADGLWGECTFDLTLRGLPEDHGYVVVAGVQEAIDEVLRLRFSDADIQWLQSQELFQDASSAWWESLRHFRFSGDVDGMRDGSLVFGGEPILRVTAPLPHAVLLETRLIQIIAHASAVATRAARLVGAADGRRIFDFGSRRVPGAQAALLSARAASVGGCAGTSYALAGEVYDLMVMGTLSNGFLAAYPTDDAAMQAFSLHFPKVGYISLPGDSFSDGVARIEPYKHIVRIVRVDHWDLDWASRLVRKELDRNGMKHVKILGSGALTEEMVESLSEKKAPVDLYAIGRQLTIGDRKSDLSLDYRIAEMWKGAEPVMITRPGASAYPGLKQVLRSSDADVVCLEEEVDVLDLPDAEMLLLPLIREGESQLPSESIETVHQRKEDHMAQLPDAVLRLKNPDCWPVHTSDRLALEALS